MLEYIIFNKMGENFKFEQIADEVTSVLKKDRDEMTAFGISDNFISFGTLNGFIHCLSLEINQGLMLGPFSPIKDLSCLGDSIAYISGKQITLYNIKTQNEVFSTTIQDAIKISICSNLLGSTALICSTPQSLQVIQRGWVKTNIKLLKIAPQGIYELIAHGHLACFIDNNKCQILNLTNEEILYEIDIPRGIGKLHWMSPSKLLVMTSSTIEILNYTQEDKITPIDRIQLENHPISISSFNQSNIVLLSSNLTIINSQKEIFFTGIPPIHGTLLSNNKSKSPFFLIGNNQIFKVELPNAKEKIKILVHEYKFDKAYELSERFKLDLSDVLLSHIDYYVKLNQFDDASALLLKKLSKNDKNLKEIIQKFVVNNKFHLIANFIPYVEDENLNNMIFTQLTDHKDILQEYLNKWPLVMITKPTMILKIKKIGLNDVLVDTFIKLGKPTEALKIAIDVKSKKCFEIIEKFPDTFSIFREIPDFLPHLFELDCQIAGKLCEINKYEIIKVIEWLPPELIIKFLKGYDKINLELEKILFKEILINFPDELIEFVNTVKFIDLEYILDSIQNTRLDLLKVFLLRKLNQEDKVLTILHSNFEVRLNYIKYYPELWPQTLIEAKESIEKTKKTLCFLHYYYDSRSFINGLEFKDYESEIKEFIKKQGKIVNIYKNSLDAFKSEEFYYFKLLYKEQGRGILFDPPFVCCRCAQPLTTARLRKCGHHSHKDCFDRCMFCQDPSILTKP